MPADTIAPGARVRIRDAEWLAQRVDRTSDGGGGGPRLEGGPWGGDER